MSYPLPENPYPTAPGIYNNPRATGKKILDVDEQLSPDVYMFKGIKAGTNVTITEGIDDLTIAAVGGGGGAAEVNDLLDGYHVATNMSVGQKLVAPSGTGNTVISTSAPTLTSGIDNTLVGGGAGSLLSTQTGNTLVGADAGSNVQNSNNTVVGADSLTGAVSGINGSNTVLGQGAGSSLTTGFNNVLLGRGTDASATVAGSVALGRNTTGTGAIAIKNDALFLPPNYVDNTEALVRPMVYDRITGECGTFPLGLAGQVLATNATTNGVEWVNDIAGTSDVNGLLDGYHVSNNIALGAKPSTYTGTNNIHVTGTALPATVGGSFNVGVGDQALSNVSLTGSNNVQLGFGAGNNITSGSGNVNIGSTNSVTTGFNNITIGQSSSVNPSGSNQIALGQGAVCTQNNSIAINPATLAPTLPTNLVSFDVASGEIGPHNLMTPNQVMGQDGTGSVLEPKSIVGSIGLTVNHTAGQIELVNDTNPINDGDIIIGNGLGVGSQINAFTSANGELIHERGGLEADVSAYDGFPQIKGGVTSNMKTNYTAVVAPTANDDNTAGYSVGSTWIDTVADISYICVDNTTSTAVWHETNASGAANITDLGDASTSASSVALGYKPTLLSINGIILAKTGPATTPVDSVFVSPAINASANGTQNTVVGKGAASAFSSASNCVLVGYNAGSSINTGASHTCVGNGTNAANGTTGAVSLGNGATCAANNGIAIGNGATSSLANALNFPTTLATTAGTDLFPMVFKAANGQAGPLALGGANQVLATNASQTGVEWQTVSGGGGPTPLICTITYTHVSTDYAADKFINGTTRYNTSPTHFTPTVLGTWPTSGSLRILINVSGYYRVFYDMNIAGTAGTLASLGVGISNSSTDVVSASTGDILLMTNSRFSLNVGGNNSYQHLSTNTITYITAGTHIGLGVMQFSNFAGVDNGRTWGVEFLGL